MHAKTKKGQKKVTSPVASRLRARGINPIGNSPPEDQVEDQDDTTSSNDSSESSLAAAEFLDARMGSIEDSNAILQEQMKEVLLLLKATGTGNGKGQNAGGSTCNGNQSGTHIVGNVAPIDVNGNAHSNPGGPASTTPTTNPTSLINQHIQAAIQQHLAANPAVATAMGNANAMGNPNVGTAMGKTAILPPSEDDNVPLDDPAIIFRSDLWHEKVNTNMDRWMLLKSLKEECYTQVPKLNYQIDIHIKVIDMLLQERLDDAYALLCDRIQFLRYQANHSLDEAIHFWEQLRAIDKPQKYKAADIAALLMSKRKEKNYTPKQSAYLQGQLDHSKDDKTPPGATPQKGGSPYHAQGQQRQERYWEQAARKNGRGKTNMWANKHQQHAPRERGHGFGPF